MKQQIEPTLAQLKWAIEFGLWKREFKRIAAQQIRSSGPSRLRARFEDRRQNARTIAHHRAIALKAIDEILKLSSAATRVNAKMLGLVSSLDEVAGLAETNNYALSKRGKRLPFPLLVMLTWICHRPSGRGHANHVTEVKNFVRRRGEFERWVTNNFGEPAYLGLKFPSLPSSPRDEIEAESAWKNFKRYCRESLAIQLRMSRSTRKKLSNPEKSRIDNMCSSSLETVLRFSIERESRASIFKKLFKVQRQDSQVLALE